MALGAFGASALAFSLSAYIPLLADSALLIGGEGGYLEDDIGSSRSTSIRVSMGGGPGRCT